MLPDMVIAAMTLSIVPAIGKRQPDPGPRMTRQAVRQAASHLHPALPLLRLLPVEKDRGLGFLQGGCKGDQCEPQEDEAHHISAVALHTCNTAITHHSQA